MPDTAEALGPLLAWCSAEGVPLIPRGGGTGMPGGNLGEHLVVEVGAPLGDAVLLDRERGLLRAGAGVRLAELERIAAEAGFFLPFLPSSAPWCRIGGVVANNGAGARSFRYSSVAPWIESIEGFFASGEPFRVGPALPPPDPFRALLDRMPPLAEGGFADWPQVRKNASGYGLDRFLPTGDPAQLLAGSEGTLALLTWIELRAEPLPERRELVLLPAYSAAELTAIALGAAEIGTVTCEFLGRRLIEMAGLEADPEVGSVARDAFALVLLEVAGSVEEVRRGVESVEALGAGTGGRGRTARTLEEMEALWGLRHQASPMIAREAGHGRISTQFIEDSVVPPARLGAYLTGVEEILRAEGLDAVLFGHAGDGHVHVNPLLDLNDPDWEAIVRRTLDAVTDLVRGLGGTLTGEHGDGRLRAPYLPRIWSERWVTAFQSVKDALDPSGVLNPGVLLPIAGQDPLAGFAPGPRPTPT